VSSDPLYYVIVCKCGGEAKPIAFLDDKRPSFPTSALPMLSLHSTSSQTLLAVILEYDDDGNVVKHEGVPDKFVDARYKDANLTKSIWKDGHPSWTIRCIAPGCHLQTQLHRDTLVSLADALASTITDYPEIPTGEEEVPARHMVPLGVLCRRKV
jgi:hypothetical protein